MRELERSLGYALLKPAIRLAVGICDGLPELVVQRLLQPGL